MGVHGKRFEHGNLSPFVRERTRERPTFPLPVTPSGRPGYLPKRSTTSEGHVSEERESNVSVGRNIPRNNMSRFRHDGRDDSEPCLRRPGHKFR